MVHNFKLTNKKMQQERPKKKALEEAVLKGKIVIKMIRL